MCPSLFDLFAPRIRGVLAMDVLFVSGAPKSGTTWLQKLLDAHPRVMCSGEGHFPNFLLAGIEQLCQLYAHQLEKVAREVYEGRPYYGPFTAEESRLVGNILVALMHSRRPIKSGTRYIGDKTPSNALNLDRLRRCFPEAKFVHIVRDGRDVAASTLKHADRVGSPILDRIPFLQAVADRWRIHNEKAFAFGARHPDQFHWLRYRDLLHDFDRTFLRLLTFLQVDSSPEILRDCHDAGAFRTLSGGRECGVEDVGSFYRKGIAGDWKNQLTPPETEAFMARSGTLMQELGFLDP